MKKYLLSLLAILALTIVGCSKSDEAEIPNDNELIASTAWDEDDPVVYKKSAVLALSINGEGRYAYTNLNSGEYVTWNLTYTYNEPNIEVLFSDGSHFGSGYIEDDVMYLDRGSFTKR